MTDPARDAENSAVVRARRLKKRKPSADRR
jgi:hypothetical protein